ncbi:MAG: GDYXXLXY domain-containing protein [Alkalinema sp. RU_4_3]|nr:GDYXXLXY domain-containing protein [Alkalinema sp. RU_4_3]
MNKQRFWLAFLLQVIVLLCIPAQAVYTTLTGRTVRLQTVPVDPYNWLTGYSQTLSYDISRVAALEKVAGVKPGFVKNGSVVYVTLESGKPGQSWKPIDMSLEKPIGLAENKVALRGVVDRGAVVYGLETYYMPEAEKDQVNRTIIEAQRNKPAIVEVKIDRFGNGIPIAVEVGGQRLKF